MFAFNGVSPMDESLAFHVSTNTFNNPAFDQDHIESSADLPASPLDHRAEINQKKKKKEDRKRSFGDGLVFAIRSKLFVIDVNFRRKFNSLREFAARHLPALFEKKQRSATTSDKRMFANSRTRNSNKIHDSSSREQFWENILVEPSSRKSLGKQKAKILNRLEQALEQKRTQQQRKETSEAQQQQHQQADGLRQIRPGILGHPLYHSYHPPTSPQPALQRPLHGGVQPLLIGSQHWVSRTRVEFSPAETTTTNNCTTDIRCSVVVGVEQRNLPEADLYAAVVPSVACGAHRSAAAAAAAAHCDALDAFPAREANCAPDLAHASFA